MAYEKQTWTTGEVITQEKLNHIEDGIADMVSGFETNMFFVTQNEDETYATTMDYNGITTFYNAHGYYPICIYSGYGYGAIYGLPLLYAGKYTSDEPPYADGYIFAGIEADNGNVLFDTVTIKSNGTIEVGHLNVPQND